MHAEWLPYWTAQASPSPLPPPLALLPSSPAKNHPSDFTGQALPLLPSLPSPDLPACAPPAPFPPEGAEKDSSFVSNPPPSWGTSQQRLPLLCLLLAQVPCSSACPPFTATIPERPVHTSFCIPPSAVGFSPLLPPPTSLAHSCQGYRQCPCCQFEATLQPVSWLACQPLTLWTKPSFVDRFPSSSS